MTCAFGPVAVQARVQIAVAIAEIGEVIGPTSAQRDFDMLGSAHQQAPKQAVEII